MQTKEKKKTHPVRYAATAAMAAFIVAILGYFTIGGGGNGGPGGGGDRLAPFSEGAGDSDTLEEAEDPEEPETELEETSAAPEMAEEAAEGEAEPTAITEVVIRVTEAGIEANGTPLEDAAALEAYLASVHSDGMEYRLVDAHAIQNTYLQVRELLDRLHLDYAESREG